MTVDWEEGASVFRRSGNNMAAGSLRCGTGRRAEVPGGPGWRPHRVQEVDGEFEQVVSRHYADVYRFALSLAREAAEAADLTQETFLRYAQKGAQLRDTDRVKAWLLTVAFREHTRRRRRARRFRHEDWEEVESELPVTPPMTLSGVDGEAVMRALRGLDEAFRAPLALFYLEDYSYREIAAILEIPVGTVMSRLSRGKAQLKAVLADAIAGGNPQGVPRELWASGVESSRSDRP